MDITTPAVVLSCAPDRHAYGVLAAIRSLGRCGIRVTHAAVQVGQVAGRSRYVGDRALLPATGGDAAIVERLVDIAKNERPVLIPMDDAAVLLADRYHSVLAQHFRLPPSSGGLSSSLLDKHILHELAVSSGIGSPRTIAPASIEEAETELGQATYPVVLKQADPHCGSSATPPVVMVDTPSQALRHIRGTAVGDRPTFLIQERIPGTPESQWTVDVYLDDTGAVAFGVVARKLRQAPAHQGSISLAVTCSNEWLLATTASFLAQAGMRGPADVGWRFDHRDGKFKIHDANPRVGACFRLFVGANGLDVVRCLYLERTDQPVPRTFVPDGRRWLLEDRDPVSSLRYLRDGELRLSSWIASYRGIDEFAWLAADDPVPFRAVAWSTARNAARKLRKSVATQQLLGRIAR